MSAAEHYQDAERNIQYAKDSDPGSEKEAFHLALAQVHATLSFAREMAELRAVIQDALKAAQ